MFKTIDVHNVLDFIKETLFFLSSYGLVNFYSSCSLDLILLWLLLCIIICCLHSAKLHIPIWVLVCWWWWFDWSFVNLIASVVTTTSIVLSSKNWLTQIHLKKWPLKWYVCVCVCVLIGQCSHQKLEVQPTLLCDCRHMQYHCQNHWRRRAGNSSLKKLRQK